MSKAAKELIDVTSCDQKMELTMRAALVMKVRMVTWLLGMATFSQMMSWGLGAWFISIASVESNIWDAMLSVMRDLNVTNAVVEYFV